jgi:hypothetical protein
LNFKKPTELSSSGQGFTPNLSRPSDAFWLLSIVGSAPSAGFWLLSTVGVAASSAEGKIQVDPNNKSLKINKLKKIILLICSTHILEEDGKLLEGMNGKICK